MSGYRRVNYYELCRLCTSSEGTKMHIFREEGRRRQLPTKIQICLPLQVCEDDSLPKIICTHCADKLESFFDFRETCINAESMLESYISTLRYSEEFIRDGKVYVKDEPVKKKTTQPETTKPFEHSQNHSQIKIATVTPVPIVQPVTVETLPGIQIVNPDTETSFKDQIDQISVDQQVSVSESIIESRYTYQTCNTTTTSEVNSNIGNDNSTNTIIIEQSEDGTQTDFSELKSVKDEINETQQFSVTSSEDNENDSTTIHQTIALQPNSDMLVHFGFNKDKDINEVIQRSSIAQIGEFLRLKSVTLVESFTDGDGIPIRMCEACGQEVTNPEDITNHVNCSKTCDANETGNEEKSSSISCDVCNKPFKRKEHLFQHRKLHTGERPYTCMTCLKSFSRKEHLVRHSVSHTGQKMHACDMCGKSFSRKDNLHKHRKTHGITGPYMCDVCGKSFVVKHYYEMHKETHTSSESTDENVPYRCDICNKGFTVKQYLTTHRARHRNKNVVTTTPPATSEPNDTTVDSDNLTTVNPAAILPPNVLHSGSTTNSSVPQPLYQVTSTTGSTLLCTPGPAVVTTTQLLETYRRLHQTT